MARVKDPRILRLIRLWLRAGVMHEGVWEESVVGTPQGGVISPLLSNIYLHPLDLYWERQMGGAKMVRYADDLVVLCRRGGARRSMPVLRRFLARLKLTVNEEKTRVVSAQEGFDFLGVHFRKQPTRRDRRRSACHAWPSPRSMQRIRDKVRTVIDRDDRPSLAEIVQQLNPVVRGGTTSAGSTRRGTTGKSTAMSSTSSAGGCAGNTSAWVGRSGARPRPSS